ncbi:MAG: Hpt domain-containing protein [Thermostichus sp. DG02_1_bins_55]
MTDPGQLFQQQLEALKVAYREQLPNQIHQLGQLWQQCKQGSPDNIRLRAFYRAAHTLAGSSGIYGYEDVSRVARHLEHLCKPWVEAANLPDPDTLEAIELGLGHLQHQPIEPASELGLGTVEPTTIYWVIQAERDPLDLANTLTRQGYQVMVCSSPAELHSQLPALPAHSSPSLDGILPTTNRYPGRSSLGGG